ncbi:MAG: DEAD/DEAH box helicase [Planctomycetes bacterium]|nr:DEAD/DEAH box helicase [Planctomycetota bacterium]
MKYKGFLLDEFQERAIRAIDRDECVFVAAPTGSGKTLVAEYAADRSLSLGRRVLYTAPIKALSNQKFRDFGILYPGRVGIMTGDVTLNPGAPLLIMTTEIFRNSILEEPERYSDLHYLIFDEVHFLKDIERGTVWEESIIFAPRGVRILALSATVPNLNELCRWVQEVREEKVQPIREYVRPVPLEHWVHTRRTGVVPLAELPPRAFARRRGEWTEARDHSQMEIVDRLVEDDLVPCLYFCFNRRVCEERAWMHRHRELLSPEEREKARELLAELAEAFQIDLAPNDQALGSLLVRGIGYHHAGMLPTSKEVVERFFTRGLVKLLFATETFAMGINMPATSVVFDELRKFDGFSFRNLSPMEYQQMAGRAGRRGMDQVGHVISCVDPNRLSYEDVVHVLEGEVERIESQFNLGYATILSLYGRHGRDVYLVADRSFAAFQKVWAAGKMGGGRHAVIDEIRDQLKRKLELLTRLGYIDRKAGGLTDKGRFATYIQGYELQVTEMFFGGVFERLDKDRLATLAAAVVFEGQKANWYDTGDPGILRPFQQDVKKRMRRLREEARRLKIRDEIKSPDFRLSGAIFAFSRGAPFSELGHFTDAGEGHLIRVFRSTVQVLRQMRKATSGYADFAARIEEAILSLDRDEVDAARQLAAGQALDERTARLDKPAPVE